MVLTKLLTAFKRLLKNAHRLLNPDGLICGAVNSVTENSEPVLPGLLRDLKIHPMAITLKESLVLSLGKHVGELFALDVDEKEKHKKIHVYVFVARFSDRLDISLERLNDSYALYENVKKAFRRLFVKPPRKD